MAHTSASAEALLLQAYETNSRECLQKLLPVWKLGEEYVVKFTIQQSAIDHQINEQMARALGLKTVQTEAIDVSIDTAIQYNNYFTSAVLMNFSKGTRLDHYNSGLVVEQQKELYSRISPDLFVCAIIGNMIDANCSNIMIEDNHPVMIDTQFGVMGSSHTHGVRDMITELAGTRYLYPHFQYDFPTPILIDAAHQSKKHFKQAIMTEELNHLTQYSSLIEERHDELVMYLEKQPSLHALCKREFQALSL